MEGEMFSEFTELNTSVMQYLAENLKPAEYYMFCRWREQAQEEEHETPLSLASTDRWQEYEKHKRNIAELCQGNERMFNKAMEYTKERMLL